MVLTGEDLNLYTYEQLVADLSELQANYSFLEVVNIGRSVEGRNLFAVGLGSGPKQVHYTGGMHANEWLTTPLLVKFVVQLCEALQVGKTLAGWDPALIFESSTLWVTPAVNPDGAELVQTGISPQDPNYAAVINMNQGSTDFRRWKSNIRGVDLNHQFPAAWKTQAKHSPKQPLFRDYAGEGPLSEPESQALAAFTREQDLSTVLAFHSQGQVIYWGYRGLEPPESGKFAAEMATLSGYSAVRYAGTHAGYKDWFIQDWRRPGFTVEVGLGTNPLPLRSLPAIYAKLLPLLLRCAVGP